MGKHSCEFSSSEFFPTTESCIYSLNIIFWKFENSTFTIRHFSSQSERREFFLFALARIHTSSLRQPPLLKRIRNILIIDIYLFANTTTDGFIEEKKES